MSKNISKATTSKKVKTDLSKKIIKKTADKDAEFLLELKNKEYRNKDYRFKTLKDSKYFEYLNLSDADYEKYLPILWRVYSDNIRCLKSDSEECTNGNGFHLYAKFNNHKIFVEDKICPKYKKILEANSFKKNYLWRSFDESLLDLKFHNNNIDHKFNNNSRRPLLTHMNEMISEKNNHGFYLYGDTGVGKSYLTILMCNSLAKKNKTIAYAFLPDVVSKFMDKFVANLGVESEVEKLTKADILILDDIGSETIREWFFNEYLLRILNYRSDHKKTSIFISNYSLDELAKYYSNKKNGVNLKATLRIIDRIKGLVGSHIYELRGKSYRTKDIKTILATK